MEKIKKLVEELYKLLLNPSGDSLGHSQGLFYKIEKFVGRPGWVGNVDEEKQKLGTLKSIVEELAKEVRKNAEEKI